MIIKAANLYKYFHSIEFPVPIYRENTITVITYAERKDLARMIQAQTVIGRGTWNRVKRIEENRVVPQAKAKTKFRQLPRCEDNQTWEEITCQGGKYFQHHDAHCAAFSQASKLAYR